MVTELSDTGECGITRAAKRLDPFQKTKAFLTVRLLTVSKKVLESAPAEGARVFLIWTSKAKVGTIGRDVVEG